MLRNENVYTNIAGQQVTKDIAVHRWTVDQRRDPIYHSMTQLRMKNHKGHIIQNYLRLYLTKTLLKKTKDQRRYKTKSTKQFYNQNEVVGRFYLTYTCLNVYNSILGIDSVKNSFRSRAMVNDPHDR